MRRGLLGTLLGCLTTATVGLADSPLPPTPTQPPRAARPVVLGEGENGPHVAPTPVIPMRSDAGIPFTVTAEATPTVLGPDPRDLEPTPRFWASGEFLLQWMKGIPVLEPVVTSSNVDPFVNPGVLGRQGTLVLFGGDNIHFDMHSGVRLSAGASLDAFRKWAVDANIVWFDERQQSSGFASNLAGSPVISRPIVDPATNLEGVFLVAFPDNFAGRIVIDAHQEFWGTETNLIRNIVQAPWGGVDVFGGVRYAELEEDMSISDASLILPNSSQGGRFLGTIVGPGNVLGKNDTFETRNQFYGGQLGIKAEIRRGNWFFYSKTKLALGNTQQVVNINGSSTLTPVVGTPITVPGGLLAVGQVIGRQQHNDLGFIPEVNLNVGYQFSEGIRVYVGYDFMYWSSVVRPGEQIDRNINRSFVPTSEFFGGPTIPNEPILLFRTSDFWLQGVNFGVAVRF
jgi:hypothetical protein